ncbi:MAG: glycosyltransferase family 39 protein [Ruminococcus sp.]|nr:glycosyltransferase family 39 protein [Ruminococcus sp.]
MKISNKKAIIILAVLIIVSLCVSTFYISAKQGYHEDELLTYNLANTQKQLNVDGGWNTSEDFNEYLTVAKNDRFNYAQVVENQIIDASHPPFYYALVHTVCSFFPTVFSRYFAYSINVLAMIGILILLFMIGKRVTGNNFYALIGAGAYALSIACFTTTIYLRMYATLTFFVLLFVYQMLRLYDKKNEVRITDCLILLPIIILGILTQYYFILFAGLTGLIFLIFKIKEKCFKDLFFVLGTAVVGFCAAMLIYPHIIENVLGGNRGFGSLEISIDAITIVTYVVYKIFTYIEILSKDLFLGQVWMFALCCVILAASFIYFRFVKKRKLNRKAMFITIPPVLYFIFISLVSPFNSDRYVMASLPFIAMLFAFGFIRIFNLFKYEKIRYAVPVCVVLACILSLTFVKPYYTYGKTNLYDTKTDKAVFVGTAMLEWNKVIDKLMLYDEAMIAQTSKMNPNLAKELESFATKRGIVTNGKISAFADSYMNNGDAHKESESSLEKLSTDKKLNSLDEITVYISRLADGDDVIDYITKNTDFKKCELIQADYSFDDFYNWYDYFVETESYCNVYKFSK